MDHSTTTAAPADACIGDLLDRPAWQRHAACRGQGTAVFFPSPRVSISVPKAVCAACPVREPCLAMALADPSLQGIWGGASDRERRRLRRVQRQSGTTSPPTPAAPYRATA